jgi:alpha-1,6-mannosyltransferase
VIVPGLTPSVAWTEYGTVVTVPARGTARGRSFVRIPVAIRRALERLVPDRIEVADRLSFRQLGVWARENHVPAVLFADDIPDEVTTEDAVTNYDRVLCGSVVFGSVGCGGNGGDSHSATPSPERSDAAKFVSIHEGVDLEIFTPLRHNSALHDASNAGLLLVCAAPLTATGAVSMAIDAVRILVDQGTDVHLVVVGDGPLRRRLERNAQGLPVQFLGANDLLLAERSEVFATADFALVTTGGNHAYGVVLESLASGTPVILSGTIGRPFDFRSGAGVSTSADPAHLVQAISRLSTESVYHRRCAARETALAFDSMPLSRAMVELHESLG